MIHPMLGEAWLAMGANRLRTALTMLGMVIGVGSVVLMMAIGQGAQYAVAQTISTMGSRVSQENMRSPMPVAIWLCNATSRRICGDLILFEYIHYSFCRCSKCVIKY